MTTIWLEGGREKVASDSPYPTAGLPPLYHQVRTLESLLTHDVVMNTYNTGTGKTVASLLYLFELNGRNKNVLFIAPTNALLAQHAEDIGRFVHENELDFEVLQVSAADLRALRLAQDVGATPARPGEILQRLIRNYLEFDQEAIRRRPIILVVNPDIFYYALYFRYSAHDRRNVFERFLTAFDYMVVDEFHYYDSKQVANFLFAFALFDQFGYFAARGRKVCLLSATPSDPVIGYLNLLFGSRWEHISPDNEPAESAGLPSVPTLTPLELSISDGSLTDWVTASRDKFTRWVVQDGLDGAIISNSLARVNAAYSSLRKVLAEERLGRITGPEPAETRVQTTARDLILATPTVDIGYNFVKMDKTRQNVDFVVCDARYGDELLQRIGRAGRVLGKSETSIGSWAVALLPPDAAGALAAWDGQRLARAEFARIVAKCDQLPPKHNLTGYIRTYAVTESFWPIYQIGKMLPTDLQDEIELLFDRVSETFAPGSRKSRKWLTGFFGKLERRQSWLADTKSAPIKLDLRTAGHVADWMEWLEPVESGRSEATDFLPHLGFILAGEAQQQALRAFVQSQVAVTEALFAFRDAFEGPVAVIYDPRHVFSSQSVNAYDLFHLVANYRLSPPMKRSQFEQACAPTDLQGDFYFKLLDEREPKLNLELVYDSEDERSDFERKWCGAPVALTGMRLQARTWASTSSGRRRGGEVVAGALDEKMTTALAKKHLPLLIVPPEDVGAMLARLRGSSLRTQRLTVRFPDGTAADGYRAVLGTAALHAHAELRGHFLMKDRLKPNAIII